jgi:hypothetical protein
MLEQRIVPQVFRDDLPAMPETGAEDELEDWLESCADGPAYSLDMDKVVARVQTGQSLLKST